MTRVDFYLAEGAATDRERLACRVVEKAYSLGRRIHVHTASEAQTRRLDDLLWTFRAGSFVPHARQGTPEATAVPITIGHEDGPGGIEPDVLVNLADEVPAFFGRFDRVAEVVGPDEGQKQLARERFRYYREHGYALETHNLSIPAGDD